MTFKTSVSIAASARLASAAAVFGLIFLAGCSALPKPPARPVVYDFGPGLPVAAAGIPAPAAAAAPATLAARLPTLALADVQSVGRNDNSTAVLYRLAYTDARQLRPYQAARWALPPAQLVQQALRTELGERRAVLSADDALAAARQGLASPAVGNAAGSSLNGSLPTLLRVELEEFSQVFSSASASTGLVRLRATLLEPTLDGEKLLGQRLFTAQVPAHSADAAGGTRALADATAQVAQSVSQWVEQLGQ